MQSVKRKMHPLNKLVILWDYFLNGIRNYLIKWNLNSLATILRLLVHFGPWRILPQFVIKFLRPAVRILDKDKTSLLTSLDVNAVVCELRKNSFFNAGVLPPDFVSRLRLITDRLPNEEYKLIHQVDENVRLLSEDPAIKNVLRAYFNSEPALLECSLFVTGSTKNDGKPRGQNSFHFDYAGWNSLNVFVYLTDVTAQSSYHSVAKGSHRKLGFCDLLRGSLTDDEANRRFGSSIEVITGPAGTLFFENTEAFHRRNFSNERRVMINMLYASHRNWFSYGRTNHNQIKNRDKAYARLRDTE